MSGHRTLSDKQLASRMKRAVASGISALEYCKRKGWNYSTIQTRLMRAGLWSDVMAAKYASPRPSKVEAAG